MIVKHFWMTLLSFRKVNKVFLQILHKMPLAKEMSRVLKTDFYCRAHWTIEIGQDSTRLNTVLKTFESLQHPDVVVSWLAGQEGNSKNDIPALTADPRNYSQCKIVLICIVSSIHEGDIVEGLVVFGHLWCLYKHTVYFEFFHWVFVLVRSLFN